MKRLIIGILDRGCHLVDLLPEWTYPFVGRWIGCPVGMASWSVRLERRWFPDEFDMSREELLARAEGGTPVKVTLTPRTTAMGTITGTVTCSPPGLITSVSPSTLTLSNGA